MPLAQFLLLNVPSVVLGLIVIGGMILFSVLGVLIVRHFVPHHKLKAHHDVADPILGILGAMYAVLLAFVVVTVWQEFEKSSSAVQQEASCLSDVYRNAGAFSSEFRQNVCLLLRDYRQAIVGREWGAMASGRKSLEAEKLLRQISSAYASYEPRSAKEQSYFDESVRKLNLLYQLRQQRLTDSKTGIHPMLYFVLFAGAVVVISFTFLFGVESLKAQITMIVLLSTTISLVLFTIMLLDFPFTGNISISPEPFNTAQLE